MDNIYVNVETSSDDENSNTSSSDEELFSNENSLNNEFMNYTKIKDYEKNRNELFTKDLEKRILVVDSHNVHQTSSFNSSNYKIIFNNENNNENTNISIHNNVIGFRLLRANIRSPPFNVNSTNNVIYYTIGGTLSTITIRPGLYTLNDLANVFSENSTTRSHYVSPSSANTVFTVNYKDNNSTDSNGRGLRFIFSRASEFTINWNTNNISRGAAKLFGFFPEDITSTDDSGTHKIHSNKTPDISSHYVDLVVPEIPQIACKHNSYGKDIIERIPLTSFHGEYTYHKDDNMPVNHFFPIKLHQLTIELYAENKEFYDCNKSDNNFEFEITLVNNLNLLK